MKYSVSSYSFNKAIISGELTQLDIVKKAKEIGFDAIEFTDLSPCKDPSYEMQEEYAYTIKREADKYGMDINAYTIGACMCMKTDEEDEQEFIRLKKQINIAKILGVKIMRHDVIFEQKRFRSFDLSVPTMAANIRRICDYAEQNNIKTCIENHGFICQDSERVERLFNAVNHKNFGLLVDMGNFLCVDEDPVIAVSRLAPYAFHVHAKDFKVYKGCGKKPEHIMLLTRGGNWLLGTTIGDGDVPVKQCIRILKNAGYNGYISIEYEGVDECVTGISKGLNNLKNIIAEVEAE